MSVVPSRTQHWLEIQAHKNPNAPAMLFEEKKWTYSELLREATRIAGILQREYHIRVGDRIFILLENSPEYIFLIHATLLLHAVIVPVSPRGTAREIRERIHTFRPILIVTSTQWTRMLRTTEDSLPTMLSIDELFQECDTAPSDCHVVAFRSENIFSIMSTSGTSGKPKAVPLTCANFEASALGSAANLGIEKDDVWLCILPLHHVGGLAIVLRSVLYGTAVSLVEKFDTSKLISTLRDHRVRLVSVVPTMLHRLMREEENFDGEYLPRLRAILLGGAPASQRILLEAQRRSLPVFTTYGLTEGSSQITTMPYDESDRTDTNSGFPLQGTELSIRNSNFEMLPAREPGTIWIRGAMVMRGYLTEDGKGYSSKGFRDGWFETGDVGYLNGNGSLVVQSRREDVIITGGENVYPTEVEVILEGSNLVKDSCVVGIPDDEWGQLLCAVIVPTTDAVTIPILEKYCRDYLAGFKIPRAWKFVSRLPKTVSGKIIRLEVQRLFGHEL